MDTNIYMNIRNNNAIAGRLLSLFLLKPLQCLSGGGEEGLGRDLAADGVAHPVLGGEAAYGVDALNLVGDHLAFELLLELELDNMAVGVVGEV